MSAPVVHHQQNKCMRGFHEAGAIDTRIAASLGEIGLKGSPGLRYLMSRGVIVATAASSRHPRDLLKFLIGNAPDMTESVTKRTD